MSSTYMAKGINLKDYSQNYLPKPCRGWSFCLFYLRIA